MLVMRGLRLAGKGRVKNTLQTGRQAGARALGQRVGLPRVHNTAEDPVPCVQNTTEDSVPRVHHIQNYKE